MPADLTATPGKPHEYKGLRAIVRHPSFKVYDGRALEIGQVFMLKGLPNDDRNKRLGFVEILAKKAETIQCRVCGAVFADLEAPHRSSQRLLDQHGFKRHVVRDTPVIGEAKLSDVDRVDETSIVGSEPDNDPAEAADVAPLYLDQTAAERGVKPEETPIEVTT